ncbi:unnamed protein product [Cylicocyclus nassatus]|uniref:Uncharacterized protein n=1 Tax=Cylicocyclus nassatus TaxID=53992 RepID=A0AA36MBN4_CYLNA|nr:unnamed protein product [Cylicocyclus nassatus]
MIRSKFPRRTREKVGEMKKKEVIDKLQVVEDADPTAYAIYNSDSTVRQTSSSPRSPSLLLKVIENQLSVAGSRMLWRTMFMAMLICFVHSWGSYISGYTLSIHFPNYTRRMKRG